MIKWICMKDEQGEKIILSMDSLDRIYCAKSRDDIDLERGTIYYIIFEQHQDKEFSAYYNSKKSRDCAFEQIQIYVNLQTAFFLEIESNTGD